MNDDTLTVRRARPTDAADMARVMADDGVYSNLMQLPFPTEEMWRARLEEMAAPASTALLLVAERGGALSAARACTRRCRSVAVTRPRWASAWSRPASARALAAR